MIIIAIFIIGILNVSEISHSNTNTKKESNSHFPKPKNGNVYVIAHRGAHIGIPENTLAAYKKAIDLGCDFVEIDIRRTKDAKFVSIHNSTIDAYNDDYSGKVADYTLHELKRLDIGSRIDLKWTNERIPTLEEILDLCKDKIGIYLDLKEPYVKEIVNIVKKYSMENEIVWYIPFSNKESIDELIEECSMCYLMPDPDLSDIENCIKKYNPKVIAPVMSQFSHEYVKKANQFDVKVFVDEKEGTEEEWEMILNFETEGIQTDDPEGLIDYLNFRQ